MKQVTVRTLVVIALVPFTLLTAITLWVDGFMGIFASITTSWGSMQIYADLFISLTIIMFWMHRDARTQGRNPWPWIVATLVVGVFGPLVYLLVRDTAEK